MKRNLFLLFCLLIVSVSSPAQSRETFDIATFQAPAGWNKQVKESTLFLSTSDTKKGTFAMITLYPSGKSTGNSSADFDTDWRRLIQGPLSISSNPQKEPAKSAGGWQIVTGGAAFQSDLGQAAVILNTFSGFGQAFSITAIFNSQNDLAAIDGFLSSIDLKVPTATVAPPAAVAGVNNAIIGTWGQNLGAHMIYGDPVAAGMAGYSKDQYTFNANGTYKFVSKTFRMAYDKIILVIENGTYEISGGNLTVRPEKSVIQSWSKLNGGDKFGRLLTSQARRLETVTYRFTRHYFSGIDQWQLVLQADNPTERDGPYSTFKLFPNAWYYSPISSNNPVIELPQ